MINQPVTSQKQRHTFYEHFVVLHSTIGEQVNGKR